MGQGQGDAVCGLFNCRRAEPHKIELWMLDCPLGRSLFEEQIG